MLDFGSILESKIEPKSIKQSINNMIEFLIVFFFYDLRSDFAGFQSPHSDPQQLRFRVNESAIFILLTFWYAYQFLIDFLANLGHKIDQQSINNSIKKEIDFPESSLGEGFSFNFHLRGFPGGRAWGPGRFSVLLSLPSKPALSFESGDDFMLPVETLPKMNRIRV